MATGPIPIEQQMIDTLKQMEQHLKRVAHWTSGPGAPSTNSTANTDSGRNDPLFEAELEQQRKAFLKSNKTLSQFTLNLKKVSSLINTIRDDDAGRDKTAELDEFKSVISEMADNFSSVSGVFGSLKRNLAAINPKSYVEAQYAAKTLARNFSDTSTQAVRAARASSMLHAVELERAEGVDTQIEQIAYRATLEKSINEQLENEKQNSITALSHVLRSMDLLDEATGRLRDNFEITELRDLRLMVGEVSASMQNAVDSADAKSFDELINSATYLSSGTAAVGESSENARNALLALAYDLQSKNLLDPFLDNLKQSNEALYDEIVDVGADGKRVLKDITEVSAKVKETIEAFPDFAKAMQDSTNAIKGFEQSLDKTVEQNTSIQGKITRTLQNPTAALIEKFGELTTAAGITALAFKAIARWKEVFDKAKEFNASNIATSFLDLNFRSVALGMSLEQITAFYKKNAFTLAQYGPKQFDELTATLRSNFNEAGLTFQQGAELVSGSIAAGVMAGINVQDTQQVTDFAKTMVDSFKSVAAISDITAEQFNALNQDLFTADGAFQTLIGLDNERRRMFVEELTRSRESLVLMGLSNEQANELLKIQQAQKKAPLKDKMRAAAMEMTRAKMAGLSDSEAQELFMARFKMGAQTDEQNKRIAELRARVQEGIGEKVQSAADQGDMQGSAMAEIFRAVGPGDDQMDNLTGQIALNKDANKTMKDAQHEQAKQLAAGNVKMAEFGQAVEIVTNLLQNPFVLAIGTTIGALAAFTFALKRASLLNLSSGMGAGPTRGKPLGKIGKIGSAILGKVGRAGLGVGGVLGAAGSYVGSSLAEGEEKGTAKHAGGKTLDAAGQIAGMASTGAMLGSFIGPAGTVVGGAVAGIIGAIMASDEISEAIESWSSPNPKTKHIKRDYSQLAKDELAKIEKQRPGPAKPPVQKAEPPVQKAEPAKPPAQKAEPPVQKAEPPVQKAEPAKPPVQKAEPPVQKAEPPVQKAESVRPPESVKLPVQKAEPPVQKAESVRPPESVKLPEQETNFLTSDFDSYFSSKAGFLPTFSSRISDVFSRESDSNKNKEPVNKSAVQDKSKELSKNADDILLVKDATAADLLSTAILKLSDIVDLLTTINDQSGTNIDLQSLFGRSRIKPFTPSRSTFLAGTKQV